MVASKDDHIEAFSFLLDRGCSNEEVRLLLEEFRAEFQGEGENQFLSYIAGDLSTIDDTLREVNLGDAEISFINKEIWAIPGSVVVIGRRKGPWSVSILWACAWNYLLWTVQIAQMSDFRAETQDLASSGQPL